MAASRRFPPSPTRIHTGTPSRRSAGRSAKTPSAPTPTAPSPATPPQGSPDSYYLHKLFATPPKPTPPKKSLKSTRKKSLSPTAAAVLSGYIGTEMNSPRPHAEMNRHRPRPTVTVFTDKETVDKVRGRRQLEVDLDMPLPGATAIAQSGGSPRSPKSPSSSGRADPEGKVLRRTKNRSRILYTCGVVDSLDLDE